MSSRLSEVSNLVGKISGALDMSLEEFSSVGTRLGMYSAALARVHDLDSLHQSGRIRYRLGNYNRVGIALTQVGYQNGFGLMSKRELIERSVDLFIFISNLDRTPENLWNAQCYVYDALRRLQKLGLIIANGTEIRLSGKLPELMYLLLVDPYALNSNYLKMKSTQIGIATRIHAKPLGRTADSVAEEVLDALRSRRLIETRRIGAAVEGSIDLFHEKNNVDFYAGKSKLYIKPTTSYEFVQSLDDEDIAAAGESLASGTTIPPYINSRFLHRKYGPVLVKKLVSRGLISKVPIIGEVIYISTLNESLHAIKETFGKDLLPYSPDMDEVIKVAAYLREDLPDLSNGVLVHALRQLAKGSSLEVSKGDTKDENAQIANSLYYYLIDRLPYGELDGNKLTVKDNAKARSFVQRLASVMDRGDPTLPQDWILEA